MGSKQGNALHYIVPGKPQQNTYVERYNRTVRYDWFGHHLFKSIGEVQDYPTDWMWTYSFDLLNMTLGGVTPKHKSAAARLVSTSRAYWRRGITTAWNGKLQLSDAAKIIQGS